MPRLNLAVLRPVIASVAGVCPTDPRIPGWASDAQERLMRRGRFVGSVVRYRFCASQACLTLPRQIETVESWALCSTPGLIRNQWYEYLGTGGLRTSESGCATQLLDRGTACSFNDISGTASKINVIAAVAEASGSRILLQGYDQNASWIRTQDSGTWIDGEYVPITSGGTRSTRLFTNLTGIQKPVTNGPVNLFEWPISTQSNLQQLAAYESDETHPVYRRYMVPGLADAPACEGASDCAAKSVTLLAKLQHIPVLNDNDWLILGCRAAFKLMVRSLLAEDKQRFDEALGYENRAVKELEHELSSFEGDGVVPILRVAHPDIFGGGSIEPVICAPLW